MVQFADEPNFKKSISNPKLKLDMVRVSQQKISDEMEKMNLNKDLPDSISAN